MRPGKEGNAAEGLAELGVKSPGLAKCGGQLGRNRIHMGVRATSITFQQFSCLKNEISVVKRIEKQLSGLWSSRGSKS